MSPRVSNVKSPPYKTAGSVLLIIAAVAAALVWFQFRGDFTPRKQLYLLATRSGLAMDSGAKVTYNGVAIGRVNSVDLVTTGGQTRAKIGLDVDPEAFEIIPRNVEANITASTVFGNKYVSFSTPKNPSAQHVTNAEIIDVTSVTTELNTLFETLLSIAEKVDPIRLNNTLAATAQALDGLGDRFGQSLTNGTKVLAELNPQMPTIRYDIARLADLSDIYAAAAPNLFDGLQNAVTTARTLNDQRSALDQALMAAIGFGDTGSDILQRGGPYLLRGTQDLVPTSQLLNEYSPAIFCGIRNTATVAPAVFDAQGGNGYSLNAVSEALGAPNPYVYPDNLPRVNAHGGPEGRPGCWAPVTRELWPAPLLVADTGESKTPYNHLELGQPLLTEYVWGRQFGENTINP
ncbi:MAG: MCE-family protein MCE1A [Mycobacterium sp.]|nr:MAG: MCE-family protein MCE1A [Mycobacterium sp.]PJE24706.1 MAG: MCE-family protein MCE1A [Mycobacterium sp.]